MAGISGRPRFRPLDWMDGATSAAGPKLSHPDHPQPGPGVHRLCHSALQSARDRGESALAPKAGVPGRANPASLLESNSVPEQPVLCLYDPLKREWRPVDAISDTIVPWTIDWLACYEVWLATGRWTGGRKASGTESRWPCPEAIAGHRRNAPPVPSSAAECRFPGRKTARSAFSRSTEAGYAECSRQPFSQRWRIAISAVAPSRGTSISSLERRRAASSHWGWVRDSEPTKSATSTSNAAARSFRPSGTESSAGSGGDGAIRDSSSRTRYDRAALERMLSECFGSMKFGRARTRLCIPSFDGRYGETYIFKTPHHPDFTNDAEDRMTKVAMATAAAPTFFRPFEDAGYTFRRRAACLRTIPSWSLWPTRCRVSRYLANASAY